MQVLFLNFLSTYLLQNICVAGSNLSKPYHYRFLYTHQIVIKGQWGCKKLLFSRWEAIPLRHVFKIYCYALPKMSMHGKLYEMKYKTCLQKSP